MTLMSFTPTHQMIDQYLEELKEKKALLRPVEHLLVNARCWKWLLWGKSSEFTNIVILYAKTIAWEESNFCYKIQTNTSGCLQLSKTSSVEAINIEWINIDSFSCKKRCTGLSTRLKRLRKSKWKTIPYWVKRQNKRAKKWLFITEVKVRVQFRCNIN